MKRFVIKNANGSKQHVMPAVHDTRKKAEETLMDYLRSYNNICAGDYWSLFDFAVVEECIEPDKLIPDFEHAKQLIGSTGLRKIRSVMRMLNLA